MRISDWSSDVCSSDLRGGLGDPDRVQVGERTDGEGERAVEGPAHAELADGQPAEHRCDGERHPGDGADQAVGPVAPVEIGRASCWERVCQYVVISGGAVSLKKKTPTEHPNITH